MTPADSDSHIPDPSSWSENSADERPGNSMDGEPGSEASNSVQLEALESRLSNPSLLRPVAAGEYLFEPVSHAEEIREVLLQGGKPPPQVMLELLSVDHSLKSRWSEIARLFEGDATLCRHVLGYINTQGVFNGKIESIARAISMLNIERTIEVGLSFSYILWSHKHRLERAEALNARHYLRHVLLVAAVSKLLAQEMPRCEVPPDVAYSTALMQKVGVMGLQFRLPTLYRSILTRQKTTREPLHDVERYVMQTDHGEAGAWLLQSWGLPNHFVESAGQHLQESIDGEFQYLVILNKLACYICTSRSLGVVRKQKELPMELCVRDLLRRVKPELARGDTLGQIMFSLGERIRLRDATVRQIIGYLEDAEDMRFIDDRKSTDEESENEMDESVPAPKEISTPFPSAPSIPKRGTRQKSVRLKPVRREIVLWDCIIPGLAQIKYGSYNLGKFQLGSSLSLLLGLIGLGISFHPLAVLFGLGLIFVAIWSLTTFPHGKRQD